MTTMEDVRALLPVISPYRLPASEEQVLFRLVQDRVTQDAPSGLSPETETRAYCYYLAYLLSAKEGQYGITAKHVGSVSVSYSGSQKNPWLSQYYACLIPSVISSCTGNRHEDVDGLNRYFPGRRV